MARHGEWHRIPTREGWVASVPLPGGRVSSIVVSRRELEQLRPGVEWTVHPDEDVTDGMQDLVTWRKANAERHG